MTRRFNPDELPPTPDLFFEEELWAAGCARIAGLDEAGRGAWAGPVAAAAVILPCGRPETRVRLEGVRDSKQMTPRQRAWWAERVRAEALAWAVGWADVEEIDRLNIVGATRLAMERALAALPCWPEHLLVDALRLPGVPLPQTALIKGDARSLSIAAASVLAKTARDACLCELDLRYPGYGFALHKGYGTPGHQAALCRLGACPEHRSSYEPVQRINHPEWFEAEDEQQM